MKYFATTNANFVIGKMEKQTENPDIQNREMRLILPSLPAKVVRLIGGDLEEYRLHLGGKGKVVKLIYKIAYALGEEWKHSKLPHEQAAYDEIVGRDWYDAGNHLTQWRNIQRDAGTEDFLMTVLVGFDRVTDQAGLADFFKLDHETLWKQVLKRSFKPWIEMRLKEKPVEFEDGDLDRMDELLCALKASSLADLVGISEFLEQLDLSMAMDGRDAFGAMVQVKALAHFNLPCMKGLITPKKKQKKSITHYLVHALEFLKYARHLDEGGRKKDRESIVRWRQKDDWNSFDSENLGEYQVPGGDLEKSLDAFVDGLERYIETNEELEREKLRTVDFVYLLDEVLDFKVVKNGPPKDKKPKKLAGRPLEVILRALWLTLGDFKAWAMDKKVLPLEELTDIQLQGDLFKHDCEGDDAEELAQNANRLLRQVLGGLDKYLENQLSFVPDQKNDPERTIRVKSSFCPALGNGALGYERAKSSEPYLKFTVTVAAGDQATKRSFIWRFPQYHSYRTMVNLFDWFTQRVDGNPVPVFSIPFFEELMLAKDEEEVNRILQYALQEAHTPKVFNLLDAPKLDGSDQVVELLKKLASKYTGFIVEAHEKGVFTALEDFPSLESAFRDAYGAFLSDAECVYSQVGPLLFKAFCVLGERKEADGSHWMWHDHEPCFLVSPLHPALMEMLYHQHAYLCESFVVAARQGLRETGPKWFNERRWADIEDLAQIQWPLHGILRDQNHFLDTNVRSFGLMHLVGENSREDAALTTRLLLRYDSDEDDEITDEDLFRMTRESRLVQRVLEDYRSLNPHADDGVAIAAYCSTDIQSLISGVDAYLGGVFNESREDRPYTLSLTLFAESQDDTTITRWVREWRQRWEAAEPSSKHGYYRGCRISVAHRMITREKNYAQFVTLLNNIDADVAFLFQFIRAGAAGNRFVKTEPYDHSGNYRMFPVLEKMCCSVMGGGHEFSRDRVISNRQFKLGTLHSGVMARLKDMAASRDSEYIVMGRGEFSPWVGVVDQLHKRSAWVVCVDPSVDEHLIAKEDAHGKRSREIIGFGSGVGAHGEHNYTVSTEEYSLATVKKKVRAHVAAKLGPWDAETCGKVAESVTREVAHMAGMSLVRAIGPSEYVRDFIAYALVRKLLPRDPGVFCDELVSLDAYRHWFDSAPTGKRPDLLHLKAKIEDGLFKVSAQLIECKLAQQSERHLEKAREQLECGLSHLIACFRPRQADIPEGLDDRPDQRYWWLQLHRLLASKGRVSPPELTTTVGALERMSDGLFSIRWSAAAVTFWTDSDRADIHKESHWVFDYEGSSLPIPIISAGRHFIRDLCTKDIQPELPTDVDRVISLSSVSRNRAEIKDDEDKDHTLIDTPNDTRPSVDIDLKEESEAEPAPTTVDETATHATITPASVPSRIFLGHGVHANMELYWEFGHKELANRHMLIFGTSGMGKTYTIQALLCELGRHGQNTLIVDYTDGFHDKQLKPETIDFLNPSQHVVKLSKVPINPFRRQQEFLGAHTLPEDSLNTAQRVAGVFSEVYLLGDQQRSAIYSAVKQGVDRYGDEMSLVHLPQLLLEGAKEGTILPAVATSVITKIQPFVDMNPFGQEDPESWEKLFTDATSRCHILQLAGYLKEASKLITEFSLIDFYWYYRIRGTEDRPRVIVLDEIQNLDQDLESPLGKFLTEGRKFGICLIMATQTLANFDKDEQGRLFQAAHKLFFRPADIELRNYAQIIANTTGEKVDDWVHRLSSLQKGECYSLGPALNKETGEIKTRPFKIRIASLSSRFKTGVP